MEWPLFGRYEGCVWLDKRTLLVGPMSRELPATSIATIAASRLSMRASAMLLSMPNLR